MDALSVIVISIVFIILLFKSPTQNNGEPVPIHKCEVQVSPKCLRRMTEHRIIHILGRGEKKICIECDKYLNG